MLERQDRDEEVSRIVFLKKKKNPLELEEAVDVREV